MPFSEARVCPGCEKDFTAKAHNSIYCSTACRRWKQNGHDGPRVLETVCRECSGPINSPRSGKVFCGKKCKLRSSEKRRVRDDAARYLKERDKRLADAKAYAQANPHVGQAAKRRRRASILANGSYKFTGKDWKRCMDRHGNRCFYCGNSGQLSMDHVVPVVRGGSHGAGNIVPACISCNCHKQGRFVAEWRHGKKRGGVATNAVQAF